jgi:succinate dehydrogenase / fumarate reductase cytochrome b subunit
MATRPKYLNLLQIRLPIPGLISILHRVSGALLFLALPLLLCGLQQSLGDEGNFDNFKDTLQYPLVKLAIIVLLWAYFHHFCAGIRHLLLDLDMGTELQHARLTAWIVLLGGILLTIVAAVRIW